MISLYRYRQYILRNALADLRHRYTGTGLGIFWNVISPLMQITVYAVVFSKIMRNQLPGHTSWVIYLCSGLLPWTAFQDCVTRGMNAFLENASYLKKLPIPEQVFVARSAVAATFSLLISLALLLIFAWVVIGQPTWLWLLLPIVTALFMAMGLGLGTFLGTINIFLRDVSPIVSVIFQIWLWTIPIIYEESVLPEPMVRVIQFNPPYPYIRALHDLLVFGHMPPFWVWPAMVGWAAATLAIGSFALRMLRAEIRDVL